MTSKSSSLKESDQKKIIKYKPPPLPPSKDAEATLQPMPVSFTKDLPTDSQSRVCVNGTLSICACAVALGFCLFITGGLEVDHHGSLKVLMYIGVLMFLVGVTLLVIMCSSFGVSYENIREEPRCTCQATYQKVATHVPFPYPLKEEPHQPYPNYYHLPPYGTDKMLQKPIMNSYNREYHLPHHNTVMVRQNPTITSHKSDFPLPSHDTVTVRQNPTTNSHKSNFPLPSHDTVMVRQNPTMNSHKSDFHLPSHDSVMARQEPTMNTHKIQLPPNDTTMLRQKPTVNSLKNEFNLHQETVMLKQNLSIKNAHKSESHLPVDTVTLRRKTTMKNSHKNEMKSCSVKNCVCLLRNPNVDAENIDKLSKEGQTSTLLSNSINRNSFYYFDRVNLLAGRLPHYRPAVDPSIHSKISTQSVTGTDIPSTVKPELPLRPLRHEKRYYRKRKRSNRRKTQESSL